MDAAGVSPDDARVKALVAALDGVNIEEAVEKASVVSAAPAAAAPDRPLRTAERRHADDRYRA